MKIIKDIKQKYFEFRFDFEFYLSFRLKPKCTNCGKRIYEKQYPIIVGGFGKLGAYHKNCPLVGRN